MRLLYEDKFLNLVLNEELNIFVTTWNNNNQNLLDEEVKEYYLKNLSIAKQAKPKFLLVDSRKRRFVYNVKLQIWVAKITDRFFKETEIEKIASILPKETIASFSTTQLIEEVKVHIQNHNSNIAFFTTLEEAYEWFGSV